jgi:membrane-associated phospholipid phosphatase
MVSILAAVLLAAEPLPHEDPLNPYVLRIDWRIDAPVTGVGLAAWVLTETALFKQLAPTACRWCDRFADGTDKLNPLDAAARGIRWSSGAQPVADALSSALAFGVLPATLVALEFFFTRGEFRLWIADDLLIVAESAVLAVLADQAVKFAAGRQRPYAHFAAPGTLPSPPNPDDNLSFFSGHSALSFALAVGFGTVAQLRGHRWAFLAWIIGLPLAAAVPWLRMSADKHYLTDVLVGSAVGAAFGYGVPTLLHGRVKLTAAPGGVAATF